MYFAVYSLDKPNSLELRMKTRPAHIEYVQDIASVVRAGGALLAEDGETMIGSMAILECDSLEEAQKWSDNDPYVKAGLYESRQIRPYNWLVGNPAE